MLSKKLVRLVYYLLVVVAIAATFLILQRNRDVFFETDDDEDEKHEANVENFEYIIDLKLKKCPKTYSRCIISDSDTKNSKLIAWKQVNKNLYLKDKNLWNFDITNYYLFAKTINSKELKNDNYLLHNFNKQKKFVEQIAVYNPEVDKQHIPAHVINDYNNRGESFSEMIQENFQYTKSKLFSSDKKEKREDKIPTVKDVQQIGWYEKEAGLWCKYGMFDAENTLQEVDILYGEDAVDPRPDWYMIKQPLLLQGQMYKTFITLSNKKLKSSLKSFKRPTLKINSDGKFKILQVADLHFSNGVGKCRDPFPPETENGCEADPRTLRFVKLVLDKEKPDMVILTGDQIFGETSPDALSSLLKSLALFIQLKIPFATTLGNHDDESSLTRAQVMEITRSLPYSLSELGPKDVSGVGNYYLTVQGPKSTNPAMLLWFLDTHKYSPTPKTNPGYDWLKENQLEWLENTYINLKPSIAKYSHIHLSMAFFHIPIPEFRNFRDGNIVGSAKEGVTAPSYNTGGRKVFAKLGVSVASVGHDHCNDYCLYDTLDGSPNNHNMWLCYAGAAGEGGYGGYGGTARRLRVYEINANSNSITSWKRVEGDAENVIDQQVLVDGGVAKM